MECFDDVSKLEFFGVFESEHGSVLNLSLTKCYGKPYCKSEEEIRDFID